MKDLLLRNIAEQDYPAIINYLQSNFKNIEIDEKEKTTEQKMKRSARFRGKIPQDIGDEMIEQYEKIRKEWTRNF